MTGRATSVAFVVCATCFGCATGTATGSRLDARFAGQDAQRARELAPDLYAGAQRAREEARGAPEGASRRDHMQRASLLLDAALTETERIQLDGERTRIEEQTERAVAERAEHERARLAAEAEAARLAAAMLAQAEMQHERDAPADAATKRAPKSERERASAVSATFLLGRAELVLAAATALGLPAEACEEALRALASARDTKGTPSERVRRARVALEAAERAWSTWRARGSSSAAPN